MIEAGARLSHGDHVSHHSDVRKWSEPEGPNLEGKRTLRPTAYYCIIWGMLKFACWFCGEGIDRDDNSALLVSVGNLWHWAEGNRGKCDPFQNLYAHSRCAKSRMTGATMSLDPAELREDG